MPAKIRTLVCVPPGPERETIEGLLKSMEAFEIAGFVGAHEDVATVARSLSPNVLILDEALAGPRPTRLARRLAQERPMPTLLLMEDVSAVDEREDRMFRQLRMYPMPKAGFRLGNEASLSFARTRLMLLATRSKEAKTTLDRGAISGILSELREEAKSSGIGAGAQELAGAPRDLIVVAGAADAQRLATELLKRVGATRVPVLVAVAGLPDHFDSDAIRARALDRTLDLRRATGIYLSPPDAHVALEPDQIVFDRGNGRSLAPATVIESTARLRDRALVIDLSPDDRELTLALDTTGRKGAATAWLTDANGSPAPAMPPGPAPLSMAEIVWLLQQTAPRRA